MPRTTSAKKALAQSIRRRKRNLTKRIQIRNLVRTIRSLAKEKKAAEIAPLLPKLYKTIDKAAKTRVVSANRAARLKSRLTKLVPRGSGAAK